MDNFRNTAVLDSAIANNLQIQPLNLPTSVMPGLQEMPLSNSAASAPGGIGDIVDLTRIAVIDSPIIASPFLFDPGETLATARNLGSLSSTLSINGSVGATDTIDFYRLSLTSGHLNVALTGLSADADIRVIRDVNSNGTIDYGEILASSSRSSTYDETVNLSGLSSGDYFVEVRRYSGDTSYKLRLSNSYTNDLLGVETDLGGLNGTRVFSGQINNNNTSDNYRFSVTNFTLPIFGTSIPTNVNVSLSGLSADADVRLLRDGNGNGIIDSGDVVTGSYRGEAVAELFTTALQTGTYFVQVNQYNGNSDYHLGISTGDWFSSNLNDSEILGEARYAYYSDGSIGRNDMIGLLRDAKDGGVIDATELTDLRAIVNHAAGLAMPDSVRVLSRKIVYSDPANPRSGIGNLFAGSSSTQMENLIGKWFLGTDRPTAAAGTTYRYASGSLFQGGASYADVDQGAVGDCYFLASLGAVALKTPSNIYNMFTDNGDGTFTVRFFNNGVADYVTVDRYLPTNSWGGFVYANDSSGMAYNNVNNELWVALAEKAYAQVNESGWIGQDNTNTYAGIANGWPYNAMKQITGRNTAHDDMNDYFLFIHTGDNVNDMWNAFSAGRSVVMNTNGSTASGIVGNHSYILTGYNYSTGKYVLYNPWGGSDSRVELTRAQIADNFSTWDSIA
jgi:Calpain family cysteine protease/Bacterial pre-peptidase C-terminal domain